MPQTRQSRDKRRRDAQCLNFTIYTALLKGGFFTDCDRRSASTLSRWKPHIYPKEFAQDSGSAICPDFRNHHLLFYPIFSRFWRSYPPRMPGPTAAGCTNSVGGRANPPGSDAVLGFGPNFKCSRAISASGLVPQLAHGSTPTPRP